ncbi:MAG: PAS domain S-box protein [Opitutaceae bacterium]|nr:PAS domain S-box protein [Opitutaceae bacterium]
MDPLPRPSSAVTSVQDVVTSPLQARLALQSGRTSIWHYDLEHGTLLADGILEHLLGFPAGSVRSGSEWARLVHPDDLVRTQAQWLATTEGRAHRFDLEFRMLDQHGSVRWFHALGSTIRDTNRHPTALAGVVHEITDRKHAEEELHELSRYNRQLLDLSPDPVFVLDPAGTIIDVNPAAQALTHAERSSLIGADFGQRFADATRARQLWTDALARGTVRDTEIGLVADAKAQPIPLLCNATALAGEDGSPRGVLVVARDISARKAAEAERFMTEARVRETQKLESLGVLAGGIAHDFNNLLTGILGNASLAKLDISPDTPPYNCVEEIEKASLRAAELCRQMLAYSGKGRFVVQLLDLSELITEAGPLLELSSSKKAKLRFFLNKHLPLIQADVNQLRQVVINLVSNAAEAIGEKDGLIRITTGAMRATREYLHQTHLAPDLPEGVYVFVEVSDNGSGMPPDVLQRIFEPFYTTKFTGRGLGLSAVLGIIRGHNGAIKTESEPGKGSSFLVLFPAAEQTASLPIEARPPAPAARRILIVDDEDTVRSVLVRMLRSFGYETVTAVNGQEAVDLFHSGHDDFRAVLLDLTMPELDGAETFREIHRLRPTLPVVLMSGYSEHDAVSRFGAQGLAGFLQKPFQPDVLRARLTSVVPP